MVSAKRVAARNLSRLQPCGEPASVLRGSSRAVLNNPETICCYLPFFASV